MKARAAPRDISSRKQNMPASGDGTANEYPRNHLQGDARPTVVRLPASEPEPKVRKNSDVIRGGSARKVAHYH